jgi:hypothetical protein
VWKWTEERYVPKGSLLRLKKGLFMRCTGCFKEFEEGYKAYATVVGSIEQFDGDYDAKAQI